MRQLIRSFLASASLSSRHVRPIVFGLASILACTTTPAHAQVDMLLGTSPKAFVEPEGFYRVIIPSSFQCSVKTRHVECRGHVGAGALLSIDVADVPASATVEAASLMKVDEFKKLPHYQAVTQAREAIDGTPVIRTKFTYDRQGNVERPMTVQTVYFIRGNKLFSLHFEVGSRDEGAYSRDLRAFYDSFKPARIDAGGHPVVEDLDPNAKKNNNFENLGIPSTAIIEKNPNMGY